MPAKRGKKTAKKPAPKAPAKAAKRGAKAPSRNGKAKPAAKPMAKPKGKRVAAKSPVTLSAPAGPPEKRDHRISRALAADLHKRHVGTRRARGSVAAGTVGGLFSKEAILELLQQPGAEYMRFYYAKHEDGTPGIVLAASDQSLAIVGGDDAMLLDQHWLCPPYCPPDTGGLT